MRVPLALGAILILACQASTWSKSIVAGRAVAPSTEIEHHCTAHAIEQTFYSEGSAGYVKRHRCIDSGRDFRYEYDAYEIISEGVSFIARSYAHDPDEAHFLRKVIDGRSVPITSTDLGTTAFRRAAAHLREGGKSRLRYLSLPDEGYAEVPR